MREINCPHIKELKRNGGYFYKMLGCELDICDNCEKILRAGVIKQIEIEDEIKDYSKRHLLKKQGKRKEERLITLKKIKCSPRIKKELRKMARDWINWIEQHVEDIHADAKGNYEFHDYHMGGINILEILFNLK